MKSDHFSDDQLRTWKTANEVELKPTLFEQFTSKCDACLESFFKFAHVVLCRPQNLTHCVFCFQNMRGGFVFISKFDTEQNFHFNMILFKKHKKCNICRFYGVKRTIK